MQTCLVFILGFIQLILCSKPLNLTDYENEYVCPYTLFRRKRANVEYTRWRSNMETTSEFIVKVLDDDIQTTSTPKQIVAVNIQPVTKRGEKIIVGVPMVDLPTTSTSSEFAKDYTRFVPPTTVPVAQIGNELYLAPIPVVKDKEPIRPSAQMARIDPPYLKPLLPESRNALRDESPPAGPQFLSRSPPPMARQFAPIAPVAFARRPTGLPMSPPIFNINNQPTRSTELSANILERTISDDFENLPSFLEEIATKNYIASRTPSQQTPVRSTVEILTKKYYDKEEAQEVSSTKVIDLEFDKYDRVMSIPDRLTTDKDIEYHNMFYNEDYKDNVRKKGDTDIHETYEDKEKYHEEKENEENYVFEKDSIDTLPRVLLKSHENVSSIDISTEILVIGEEDHETIFTNHSTKPRKSDTYLEATNNGLPDEKSDSRTKRRPVCSLLKIRQLSFNSPRTLSEIIVQLKQWAEDSPLARWVDITNGNFTTMENPIYMMIVDDPSSGQIISAKQTVMVLGGIQGRDHHAVAAAMYLLYQLIERTEQHNDLLSKYRFWIIPVFNPDGYDYSMTFPHVAEELQAEHPCGALYAGTRQLSEIETKALTHFLHTQRSPIYSFIAYKEGDVLGVMYPYSHTKKKRAFDNVYRQRASRAASAAYSVGGRPYVAGQTSEFLPLYAGGVEDWIDGHLGIENTYTIMMFRSTDSYNSKLVTERVVHEAYAALDTLLIQSVEPLSPAVQPANVKVTSSLATTSAPSIHLIIGFTILYSCHAYSSYS